MVEFTTSNGREYSIRFPEKKQESVMKGRTVVAKISIAYDGEDWISVGVDPRSGTGVQRSDQ